MVHRSPLRLESKGPVNKLSSLLMRAQINLQSKLESEEGQGVIEYVLVAGVISLALFVAFQTTGIANQITGTVGNIVTVMSRSATS
jgi:Flp pilus assembly pilin Flp